MQELLFLPGSIVRACQVCILTRKLAKKGFLDKITFLAESVLLPRLPEAKLTAPKTKVGILSIETQTYIEEIDYLTKNMNIKQLDLVVR